LCQFGSPLVGFFRLVPGFIEVEQIFQKFQRVGMLVTRQRGIADCVGLFACLYEFLKTGMVAQGGPGRVESK
jgi:hypothetical protein